MTVVEKTFAVTPVGVGRKDYSKASERSVKSAIVSYQRRYYWSVCGLLPAGPLGLMLSFLDSDGVLQPHSTDVPVSIFDILVSTSRNSLLYVDFRSYDLAFGDMEAIAENEGYGGRSPITFKNGWAVRPNRIYMIVVWDLGGVWAYFDMIAYGVQGRKETV